MASVLSISEFFKIRLKAPLVIVRQSWGAVATDNSAVYLAIWQDEIHRDDPKDPSSPTWVYVLWGEQEWKDKNDGSFAREERIKHLELIKSGVPGYAVVKVAKDVSVMPRQMKEYNPRYLISLKNEFRTDETGRVQVMLGEKVEL
jgi:hypothetical protein